MPVNLKRINDNSTQLRTNIAYVVDVLNNCNFARHIKTTKAGDTFIIDRPIEKIPHNIYDLSDYFKVNE